MISLKLIFLGILIMSAVLMLSKSNMLESSIKVILMYAAAIINFYFVKYNFGGVVNALYWSLIFIFVLANIIGLSVKESGIKDEAEKEIKVFFALTTTLALAVIGGTPYIKNDETVAQIVSIFRTWYGIQFVSFNVIFAVDAFSYIHYGHMNMIKVMKNLLKPNRYSKDKKVRENGFIR